MHDDTPENDTLESVIDAALYASRFDALRSESALDRAFGACPESEDPRAPVATKYPIWDLLRSTWGGGSVLPKGSAERKEFPVWSGFDRYFPAAIVAISGWSKTANEKHNPGQPLQHARGKSMDHQDCQRRHALDSSDPTCDKLEELTCKAWRAMAELEEYAESLGAPAAPAATFPGGAK